KHQIPDLTASKVPNLDTGKLTSGTLPVARGGTGQSSLALGNVLLGNGTNGVQQVTVAALMQLLLGAGILTSANLTNLNGTSGSTTPYAIRWGPFVMVKGSVALNTSLTTAKQTAATIPAGYRPAHQSRHAIYTAGERQGWADI